MLNNTNRISPFILLLKKMNNNTEGVRMLKNKA